MQRRTLAAAAAAATVAASLAVASPAAAASPDVVISQVYGGGGNSGATYTNDFIELRNEAWRLRAEGLKKSTLAGLRDADKAEAASLDALRRLRRTQHNLTAG